MGGEAKVTLMVLKVDLGCKKCYRKIKKVLCSTPLHSTPQIKDKLFDEKSNTVTISVICYTPEKLVDKICSKAGGTIKGIDVKTSQPPAKTLGDKPKEGPGPGPPPQNKQAPSQADKSKSTPPGGGGGGGGGGGEKPNPPPQKMVDGGGGEGGGGNADKPKK